MKSKYIFLFIFGIFHQSMSWSSLGLTDPDRKDYSINKRVNNVNLTHKDLTDLSLCSNKESIFITHHPLDNEALAILVRGDLTRLEILSLTFAQIEDSGIEILLLGNFPALRKLYLNDNNITHNGLVNLLSNYPWPLDCITLTRDVNNNGSPFVDYHKIGRERSFEVFNKHLNIELNLPSALRVEATPHPELRDHALSVVRENRLNQLQAAIAPNFRNYI